MPKVPPPPACTMGKPNSGMLISGKNALPLEQSKRQMSYDALLCVPNTPRRSASSPSTLAVILASAGTGAQDVPMPTTSPGRKVLGSGSVTVTWTG